MTTESVKVIVRCRPLVDKEIKMDCKCIIEVDKQSCQMSIVKPGETDLIKTFRYDEVFDQDSQQQQVYDEAAFSLVESAAEGYNGTIFAYGQTGCGKTHTMVGSLDDENMKGVMPKSFQHIFSTINSQMGKGMQFLIRCSFIEIYNEEVRDLLNMDHNNKKKLEIKEDPNKGVYIKDCLIKIANTAADLEKALKDGNKNKTMGETLMNRDSSRSHCIFTIYVETSESLKNDQQKIKMGKLNLVDLAGSEKQKKTGAVGQRLKEATKINLSLSALMNVITCLVDGKSTHIPYRDSKLTRLLQDSLGGNTKTCMIANISPADYNYDETLSTLRYADRAKNIKNKPKINQDPKDALLREYAEEIKKLKEQLAMINQQSAGTQQQIALQNISLTQSVTIGSNKSNIETLKNPVTGTLHQSLSQSPMMHRGGVPTKLGFGEVNSSGGSLMSRQKVGVTIGGGGSSGLGEDEFVLSNSEFLTDDENNSRNKSPTSAAKAKLNRQISKQKKLEQINSSLPGGQTVTTGSVIEDQVRQKLEEEARIKAELEMKVRELEERLQHDGNQIIEAQQQKMQAYREYQIKLKQQKQREREILEAKAKQEEDLMNQEKIYQSLQDEVQDIRKLNKKFRIQYKQAITEIKDLNAEHAKEKAEWFEIIQEFEKENSLFKELFRMLISERELQKIIQKCEYDVDNKKWDIPMFTIKEKSVQLPKMPSGAKDQKSKNTYKKTYAEEQRSKNAILILDKNEETENDEQQSLLLGFRSQNTKKQQQSMSQTNYDRWKDFSQGRKSLQDFADGNGNIKGTAGVDGGGLTLQKQVTIAKYQNSASSFTAPQSRDASIENSTVGVIIPNKKSKKMVKLKPLIPPGQNPQPIVQSKTIAGQGSSDEQRPKSSKRYDKDEPLQLTDLKYGSYMVPQTPQQNVIAIGGGLNNSGIFSASQNSATIGKTLKMPMKVNLAKKLDPIAKKNLIQQLQKTLNKDTNKASSSNIQTTNNNNMNYNIVNFNFYNKSPNQVPADKPNGGTSNQSTSRKGSTDDQIAKRKSIELNIKATVDIEDY